MKFISGFIFILMTSSIANGQGKATDLEGIYYLRGVMEMASGIKLNPDSSFEFFYSYGALDRMGRGNWSFSGNKLILNSRPRPESDFQLVSKSKIPNKGITVKIRSGNTMVLPYFEGVVGVGSDTIVQKADGEGLIRFSIGNAAAIGIYLSLCADRISWFPITEGQLNYFEFEPLPFICEVFFDHLVLTHDNNQLKGQHPLLPEGEYRFVKE